MTDVCPSSSQEKITELSAEKEALNERLQAEEERRKRILTDKNLVRRPRGWRRSW